MRVRAMAVRACGLALAVAVIAWCSPQFGAVYVKGSSMAPALVPGDLVVYRRGADTVGMGDVVLVAKTGWPHGVLHRVVGVGFFDRRITLRGDANPVPDRSAADPVAVEGVAVAVVPTGKAIDAVRGFVRGWYDRSSQHAYRGDDGEARGAGMTRCSREGPVRLQGSCTASAPAVHSISRPSEPAAISCAGREDRSPPLTGCPGREERPG